MQLEFRKQLEKYLEVVRKEKAKMLTYKTYWDGLTTKKQGKKLLKLQEERIKN